MVFIGEKKSGKTPQKRGRKNAYETKIKPNLAKIAEWAQEKTEAQICLLLGITQETFYKYKREKSELSEALKKGRTQLVKNLYSTLIKKAEGFQYTEGKTIEERDPQTGQLIVTRKETYTRTALPDVAALNLLLKNYDRENWANDPQLLELKKEELEIQKKKAEDAAW